jgi:hypothetical protein
VGTLVSCRLVDRNWSKTAECHLYDFHSYDCSETDLGEVEIRVRAALGGGIVAGIRSKLAHDALADVDIRYHRWLSAGWIPDYPDDNVFLDATRASGHLARAREVLVFNVEQTVANLLAVRLWIYRKYVRNSIDGKVHSARCGEYKHGHLEAR